MKNKSWEVAFIGCGDIAGGYDERKRQKGIFTHAGAYQAYGKFSLAAAYDPDTQRLKRFSKHWNVPFQAQTLAALLNRKYDVISVCAPDNAHATIISAILKKKAARIIWAEKPLALTAHDARRIIAKAKAAKIGILLSNQRRWEPCHIKIRDLIRTKTIGDILHVNGYYVKGITHIGCTLINTLRFLCGDVVWAEAIPPYKQGSYGNDPSLNGCLGFRNNATAFIKGCDAKEYEYSIFELDLIGSRGRITLTDNGNTMRISKPHAYRAYAGFKELVPEQTMRTHLHSAMELAADTIAHELNGSYPNMHSAQEGLFDLIVVEALKRSAQQKGKRIVLA